MDRASSEPEQTRVLQQAALRAEPSVPIHRRNGVAYRHKPRPANGPWLQVGSSRGFEWHRVDLALPALPAELEGFRILHVSDFHAWAHWDPAYDDLIDRVRKEQVDMILFTGDFVDCKRDYSRAMPVVRRVMEGLTSRLGTFAILGNHDNDLLAAPLGSWGVRLVDARRLSLESGTAAIELIGFGGVDRGDLDPWFVKSTPPKKERTVRIVMSHFPDSFRRAETLHADLFLAGHTHGGQICLPSGRPISSHDSLPLRYCRGIHRVGETWLIVNRGFGFSSKLRVRTFCPAEVIEIKLVGGEPPGEDVEL
jgi:predicted MPP superfamily phosphohydrolase